MFHNLSIRNKLVAGFGAIVAISLSLLILAYDNFARLSEANAWNRHTLEVLRELDTIATSVLQMSAVTQWDKRQRSCRNLVAAIRVPPVAAIQST